MTDVAVVSGDTSTLVLDNEVSTVATTSIDMAVTHTDPNVFPQSDMETQSLPQSDSSNMEGRERIDDESAQSGFFTNKPSPSNTSGLLRSSSMKII